MRGGDFSRVDVSEGYEEAIGDSLDTSLAVFFKEFLAARSQGASHDKYTTEIQSNQCLRPDLHPSRNKTDQTSQPDSRSSAKFASPEMCQNHADDGTNVQEGADQLLRSSRNVPPNFRFLVFITVHLEETDHGLKATDCRSIIPGWH